MFLEFKAHSSIYYNLLLKVADFIIGESLKLTKGIVLHVWSLLRPIIYFLSFGEDNIDLNMWLTIIQTSINFIIEHIEFKAHSSIYYNLLLKVADFIIEGSLKLTKRTVLHMLSLLRPIIYFLSFGEENIDLNVWLTIIQTSINFIPEHIEF